MIFAQPHWLFVGLIACIGLAFLFRFMQKRRQAALEKFAAHQLIGRLTRNISGSRRRYKNILLLLAVFMCFAALARPQYGFKWVEVQRKGIDLLFALDTSKSMLTEDIKPYRLKRAHLAILDFVRQLEGDRVGLMPFAGSSYLMCPLTLDYDAFEHSLSAITTKIIPRGGTNIAVVINKAVETLNNAANHKILIILTDGENLEGDAIKAAEETAKLGLTVYTVGVGTSEGELIPVAGENGKGFVKDKEGNFVTSRLDETTLSAIAEKSGGLYVPLGPSGEGLETIYQQKLALIPKEELAERRHKVPLERFEWPLAAGLLILVLELLVGERKKPPSLP
ncbi:MAG: VWA domain-containing protein, partial [Desulfobulbaceae bacterium]|nr:VWA domain-containing protein [Desulfobulbaceae bacterium]